MTPTLYPKILIVDDEERHLKALCDTLQNHGYDCVGFTSGKAALEALEQQSFDLLLTDLMMAEMGGIDLLHAALEADEHLVGVIMTGQGTIDTAVEAMKTGALDYVLKPLKMSVVVPVLSRALTIRQLRLENAQLQRRVLEHTIELEAANKELDSFCHSVSHDLRAPLRALGGYAQILLEDHSAELSQDGPEFLQRISDTAKQMGRLLDDLLRLSHLGRHEVEMESIPIERLVQEVIEEQLTAHQGRQIEIKTTNLFDCVGDAALVRQVFVNLLSNAFKFTQYREIAVIEVGCEKHSDHCAFFVKDNGAGFDMQYARALFETFQRFHSGGEFEGNGVGLSIVQRIVSRHGGEVWAESEEGHGATFFFTLPTAPPPSHSKGPVHESQTCA